MFDSQAEALKQSLEALQSSRDDDSQRSGGMVSQLRVEKQGLEHHLSDVQQRLSAREAELASAVHARDVACSKLQQVSEEMERVSQARCCAGRMPHCMRAWHAARTNIRAETRA